MFRRILVLSTGIFTIPSFYFAIPIFLFVIPAQTGIHDGGWLDPRMCGDDDGRALP